MSENHIDSKLNVLITTDKVGYEGKIHGPGRSFLNIVSSIDRERSRVVPCILRKEDSLKPIFERRGIKINYLGRGEFDPFVFFYLIKLIKNERIHVVHLNGYRSSIFGRLARIVTGVPTIMHARGASDFYGWKKNNRYSWYQKVIDRFLARFTDLVIAVSDEVKEIYVQQRKIDPKKVIVMPNAIALERFKPLPVEKGKELRKQLGLKPDHLIVGTVTRFIEIKGNKYFLEAAKRVLHVFPNAYFLVVGEGPLFSELKQLCQRLGIDKSVIFTGFRNDIPQLLSIFDVKVIPSLSEGSPNVLLEALAAGKPIVATDVGGISDILRDGETGLLVPPQDPHAMSERIIYLLQCKEVRERLAMKARKESRKYSLDTYVKNLENVYVDVARGTRSSNSKA